MFRRSLIPVTFLVLAFQALAQEGSTPTVREAMLTAQGKLTPKDPLHPQRKSPFQSHTVKLQAGKSYEVNLLSNDFDAYLMIENPAGKVVAENDDGGDGTNSRLYFTPATDGEHRLIATTYDRKVGSYQIGVRLGADPLAKAPGPHQVMDARLITLHVERLRKLTMEQRTELAAAQELFQKVEDLGWKEQYQTVLPMAQECLTIRRRLLGDQDRLTLASLSNLGWILRELGRLDEAEVLLKEDLRLRTELFGKDHPALAHSFTELGLLAARRKSSTEAERLYSLASSLLKSSEDTARDHDRTYYFLKLLRQNKDEKAKAGYFLYKRFNRQKHAFSELDAMHQAAEKAVSVEDWTAARAQYAKLLRAADATVDISPWLKVAYRLDAQHVEVMAKLTDRQLDDLADVFEYMRIAFKQQQSPVTGRIIHERLAKLKQIESLLGVGHYEALWMRFLLMNAYRQRGDDELTETTLDTLLKQGQQTFGPHHPILFNWLSDGIRFYSSRGQHEKANALVDRAESALRQIPELVQEAEQIVVTKVVTLRSELSSDTPVPLAGLLRAGRVLLDRGQHEQARPIFEQAIDLARKSKPAQVLFLSVCLEDLSGLLLDLGDYTRAEPLLDEAISIRKTALGVKHADYAIALHNLALLWLRQGRHAQALPILNQCQELLVNAESKQEQVLGHVLLSLAFAERKLGRLEEARAHHIDALQALKAKADQPIYATALNNLGELHQALGDVEQAQDLLEKAREKRLHLLGADHPEYADSLHDLAVLHAGKKDFIRAARFMNEALEIMRRHFEVTRIAQSERQQLAMAQSYRIYLDRHIALGLLGGWKAEHLYQEASLWKGLVFARKEELLRGIEGPRKGYLGIESEDAPLPGGKSSLVVTYVEPKSSAEKAGLKVKDVIVSCLGQNVTNYDRLAGIMTGAKEGDQVQISVLRAGNEIKLNATLGTRQTGHPELEPLFRNVRFFTSSVANNVFLNLHSLEFRYGKKSPEQLFDAWKQDVEKNSSHLEKLQAELNLKTAQLVSKRKEPLLDILALKQNLPTQGALLDFFEFSPETLPGRKAMNISHLAVFVVRSDMPIRALDLGPVMPIRESLQAWLGQIQRRQGMASKERETFQRLVWQPLLPHLDKVKHVLISPDGVVAQAPWAALAGLDPKKYLLEELSLSIAPLPRNLSSRRSEPERMNSLPSMLVVGDVLFGAEGQAPATRRGALPVSVRPLPGSRGEIASIKFSFDEVYPDGDLHLLQAKRADRDTVYQMLPKYRWVHLATHGFFATERNRLLTASAPANSPEHLGSDLRRRVLADHPWLQSGLILAGYNETDADKRRPSLLTALEVSGLDLRELDLAVLSACETALGESARGEGVLSLQQAFQTAGASSVIASLWKIDDRGTRMLMQRFYDNLWKEKMPKLEALREAQLWMLSENYRGLDFPNGNAEALRTPPFYWAAFSLSGDWR